MGERARSQTGSRRLHASSPSTTSTAGKLAAQSWLAGLGLTPPALTPWHIEVFLDVRDAMAPADFDERRDTRFHIEIYSEEWGVFFCHRGSASWIRVTDIPFVHGRDDFGLLKIMPALPDVGMLMRTIEKQHKIALRREHALVRTNLQNAEVAVRAWLQRL